MRCSLALIVMLLPLATTAAEADWSSGAGYASFESAPHCPLPSTMVGAMAYQRWPEMQDGYLELTLADPYCPQAYFEQTLVFHGGLDDQGSCLRGSFPWEGALCLSDPVVVDAVMHRFDALLCVDAPAGPWCTPGVVHLTLV